MPMGEVFFYYFWPFSVSISLYFGHVGHFWRAVYYFRPSWPFLEGGRIIIFHHLRWYFYYF